MRGPLVGILALTRSPEREARYRWVQRILTDDLVLAGGTGIDVADLERVPESRIHTALEATLNCEVRILVN